MTKKYFTSQIILNIIDYLTRNNIDYKISKKDWIVIGYSVSGQVFTMCIYYDDSRNVIIFQAEAIDPIPDDEIHFVYECLNTWNAGDSLGKFYLCPDCNRKAELFYPFSLHKIF